MTNHNVNKHKALLLGISILALGLAGCAKYNPKPLTIPKTKIDSKSSVEVGKYVFSDEESKKTLDRRFSEKGLQPIQLYVKNNSDQTLYLNAKDIGLQLEQAKNVSHALHRSTGMKAVKYFIIGGPIWAGVEAYSSHSMNKNIDADIELKTINDGDVLQIKPNGSINKVVFVTRENLSSSFDIILRNSSEKEVAKITL